MKNKLKILSVLVLLIIVSCKKETHDNPFHNHVYTVQKYNCNEEGKILIEKYDYNSEGYMIFARSYDWLYGNLEDSTKINYDQKNETLQFSGISNVWDLDGTLIQSGKIKYEYDQDGFLIKKYDEQDTVNYLYESGLLRWKIKTPDKLGNQFSYEFHYNSDRQNDSITFYLKDNFQFSLNVISNENPKTISYYGSANSLINNQPSYEFKFDDYNRLSEINHLGSKFIYEYSDIFQIQPIKNPSRIDLLIHGFLLPNEIEDYFYGYHPMYYVLF